MGGRLPVNPSGGLKAKGHPPGATGIAQCVELFEQLRGDSTNQVDGASGRSRTTSAAPPRCRRSPSSAPNEPEWGVSVNLEDLILVSVDDHVIEPPNMFDVHIPDAYRDRAPRVLTDDDGDRVLAVR